MIDRDMMEVIASMKSLTYLRLSHNSLQSDIFKILSTNCNALRAINLSHCKGSLEYPILFSLSSSSPLPPSHLSPRYRRLQLVCTRPTNRALSSP
ncbi:hypothetical protein EON63_01820 [archaeon]|nr:MAG: hypothetical protein EON63_01820 [archaeon]